MKPKMLEKFIILAAEVGLNWQQVQHLTVPEFALLRELYLTRIRRGPTVLN